ncbi:MAG: AAA family ATPase [Solirubrobacterales bacterium]|nr:AAA family ATPase [Solirubrobacterales bacterium]
MAEPLAGGPQGELLGRERERAVIERLLTGAQEGEGGALVIRGEAGFGKTALLGLALAHAPAMTVLRVTGVEAEADLAFAGLFGLLRPILDHLSELPDKHVAALEGALGLGPSADADRLLVSGAVLGLLAAASERQPLVCVVDDAHWLDMPSADALVFTARRLGAERVAMLFASRDGEAQRFEADGIPVLRIAGLDADAAASLLARRSPEASPVVRARLLAEAEGNPLALLELPDALSRDQLAGRAPLPEAVPLTPRLSSLFRARVEELPAETQQALLVAAIDGTGELATILGVLADLGVGVDSFDPAERAALIRSEVTRVEFRHPLVRAAVYERGVLSERQRVHAALARVLTGEEHIDRRVWHQAMAAVTGDEEVAVALEASARRAQLRAGHASAASAFTRAAELTVDADRRGPRLSAAAQAAWDAGQPERALDLIVRALPLSDASLRARLLYLRGVIEVRCGSVRDGAETLLDAAADADPELALAMLHEAAEAAGAIGRLDTVRQIGERAAGLNADGLRAEFSQRILVGAGALVAGELERARTTLDAALGLATQLSDDPRAQIWAANAAGGEPGTGLTYTARAVEIARRDGLFSMLPLTLEHHAKELLRAGRLDLAYVAAQEGYALSIELGHGAGWHLVTMAYVEAIRGQEDGARDHVAKALELAQHSGDTYLEAGARAASGLLELTLGRPSEAASELAELTSTDREDLTFVTTVGPASDVIEAIVRGGFSTDDANAPLALLRDWARHSPSEGNRAMLARAEGLLEARPPEQALTEAVQLSRALTAFERARTELLFGEWLRRQRRRSDARAYLRDAIERFRSIGAMPWTQRAENELRATGETARRRDPSTLDQLTPQELQIAGLVASGLTNREIGEQLFLSPRTVEYHLRKVFTKLGLASRGELIRHRDLLAAAA